MRRLRFEALEDRRLLAVFDGAVEQSGFDSLGDPPSGAISGSKWNDLDGDGDWDAGEPGVEGWSIYVDGNQNGRWDAGEPSDTTGANGAYSIGGLAAGTHWVAEQPRPGWTPTFPDDPGPGFEGSEFPVSASGDAPLYIDAASSSSGSFVIVWTDNGGDGSSYGVLAQLFHADGTPNGGEIRVNTYTEGRQADPSVAMDDSGRFVVVWESWDQDGSSIGVYAQRYHADGTPDGGEFRVNTHTDDFQAYPCVAMNGSGEFLVAWESHKQNGAYTTIYGQRYHADGTANGGEFQVGVYYDYQRYPCAAMADNGDYVIGWSSSSQDGDSEGIIARIYYADGTPAGDEFVVNTHTAWSQSYPDIASNDRGQFVMVWESDVQDGSERGIFGQRFEADGRPVGSEFQVNTYTTEDQDSPSVAMDGLGNFVVVWESWEQDGSWDGIYAQMYHA